MSATSALASPPTRASRVVFGRALAVAIGLHLLGLYMLDTDFVPKAPAPIVLDVVLERVAQDPETPRLSEKETGASVTAPEQPRSVRTQTGAMTGLEKTSPPAKIDLSSRPSASSNPTLERPRDTDRTRLNLELGAIETAIAADTSRVGRVSGTEAGSAIEAAYLKAWRQRVERIGNANYPGGGVEGRLRMLVVVDADGTLVEARLLTSSGVPALDAAALRIVRLSAPYPAFPVELRRRFDRLEIVRSWQFSRRGARIEH